MSVTGRSITKSNSQRVISLCRTQIPGIHFLIYQIYLAWVEYDVIQYCKQRDLAFLLFIKSQQLDEPQLTDYVIRSTRLQYFLSCDKTLQNMCLIQTMLYTSRMATHLSTKLTSLLPPFRGIKMLDQMVAEKIVVSQPTHIMPTISSLMKGHAVAHLSIIS